MIQIAPGVYADSWNRVQYGYVHGEGTYRQFVITLRKNNDSHTVAVRGKENILATLRLWDAHGMPIQSSSTEARAELPPSISEWLSAAKDIAPKKIPRR